MGADACDDSFIWGMGEKGCPWVQQAVCGFVSGEIDTLLRGSGKF